MTLYLMIGNHNVRGFAVPKNYIVMR
jgi:hypothetical protein